VAEFNGGLAHRGDTICAEDVPKQQWKYTDGSAWHVDPLLTITCLDKKSTPKCTYSDGVQFVGGDLPEEFGGGGIETSMNSTADCIAECESRKGCLYWTWVQKAGTNCYLKMDRIESVRRPKYVSGSIPSVCYRSGLPVEDEEEELVSDQDEVAKSVCTYDSIDFVGGDLYNTAAAGVAECRQQCSEEPACKLFTFSKSDDQGCYLKTDAVKARVDANVVSGAGSDICQDFVSPHVPEVSPTFDVNEINGKFKIMMNFTDELNDSESEQFKTLAGDLEQNLKNMLDTSDLSEQATFNVIIDSFRPGSVVCNFKVNYVLKEAYLALPFAIKPSNITDTMNKNFKFKKGILFQKFLIVGGSFKASAPVDHCAAKGCSHKCNYDYDLEDYVCTCPPTLTLDADQKTCVDPTSGAATESDAEETTLKPEISVAVLPTDCIWSAWSDWSECLCGVSTAQRSRSMLVPANNGGECSGEYEEVKECDTVACDGSDVFIQAPENTSSVETANKSVATEKPEETEENVGETTEIPAGNESVTMKDVMGTVTDTATTRGNEQSTVEPSEEPTTYTPDDNTPMEEDDENVGETSTINYTEESSTELDINADNETTKLAAEATTKASLETENNHEDEYASAVFHEEESTTDASMEFGKKINEETTVSSQDQVYDDDVDDDVVDSVEDAPVFTASPDPTTGEEDVSTARPMMEDKAQTDVKVVITTEATGEEAQEEVSTEISPKAAEVEMIDQVDTTTVISTETSTAIAEAGEADQVVDVVEPVTADINTDTSTEITDIEGAVPVVDGLESVTTNINIETSTEIEGADQVIDDAKSVTTDSNTDTSTETTEIEEAAEIDDAVESVTTNMVSSTENSGIEGFDQVDDAESVTTDASTVTSTKTNEIEGSDQVVDGAESVTTDNKTDTSTETAETEETAAQIDDAVESVTTNMESSTDNSGIEGDMVDVVTTDARIETSTKVADIEETSDFDAETSTVDSVLEDKMENSAMLDDSSEGSQEVTTASSDMLSPKSVTETTKLDESTEMLTKEIVDVESPITEGELVDVTTKPNEDTTSEKPQEAPVTQVMLEDSTTTVNPTSSSSFSPDVTSTETVYTSSMLNDVGVYDDDTDDVDYDDGEVSLDEATTVPTIQDSSLTTETSDKETSSTTSISEETTRQSDVEITTIIMEENSSESETTTSVAIDEEEVTETSMVGADNVNESTSETTKQTSIMHGSTGDDGLTTTSASVDKTTMPGKIVFPLQSEEELSTTLRPDSDVNFPTEKVEALPNPTTEASVAEESVTSIDEFSGPDLPDPEILSQTKEQPEEKTTTEVSAANDEKEATASLNEVEPTTESGSSASSMDGEDTMDEEPSTEENLVITEEEQDEGYVTASPRFFTNDATSPQVSDSTTSQPRETTDRPVDRETSTILNESTTKNPTEVTVIDIQTNEDTTVVVTTVRPDTEMDDTTALPAGAADNEAHEFDCVEVESSGFDASPDQIPMQCTQMDGGEKKRRVYLLINKSQVDEDQLFAKNVKVIVKDLMVMDISNQSQVR